MTSLHPSPRSARAFRRSGLGLLSRFDHAAPAADLAEDLDELDIFDEAQWQEGTPASGAEPPPREWLFWSFLMGMAITALPLAGVRWTTPQAALTAGACGDVLLWALPVVMVLPFLFLGCVLELAFRPASRTPAAFGAFGAAIVIGLAAVRALVA
jgi:hypothetical protein